MSAEYEAAQEICVVLRNIEQVMDWINDKIPSQRERIATAAMQGLLASGREGPFADFADDAIGYTDSLIVALNKTQIRPMTINDFLVQELLAACELIDLEDSSTAYAIGADAIKAIRNAKAKAKSSS